MPYANPIDALSGPEFLFFYAPYCAAVVAVAAAAVHREDPSARIAMPPAAQADPFEIAYLRGGTNDVLRLTMFELVHGSYLRLDSAKPGAAPDRLGPMPLHPPLERLPHTWRLVFDFFQVPREPAEIFRSPVRAQFDRACDGYRSRLQAEQLLSAQGAGRAAWPIRIGALAALLAPFAYRLATSLAHQHRNIIFMLLIAIASTVALAFATRVRRITARGRRYMSDLQLAYRPAAPGVASAAALLPLLVAVNGSAALAQTQYAPMSKLFARGNASPGGGDAGACGSGGCSGGSSGGCGGGGCGGGGCS